MDALPFRASSTDLDASSYRETTYEGLIRLQDDQLILEYEERVMELDAGSYQERRRGVTEIRIPLAAVAAVELRRRLLRGPLVDIQLARLEPASEVPWLTGTRIRVQLSRKHRHRGPELATEVRLLQADTRLRELGEEGLAG